MSVLRPTCPPWSCASATPARACRMWSCWPGCSARWSSGRPVPRSPAGRRCWSAREGDLVDPATAAPVPARQLIRQLVADLRPALETTGDWDQVTGLTDSALARFSSAARQRAAYARGGLEQVVDTLMAETRAGADGQPGATPADAADYAMLCR